MILHKFLVSPYFRDYEIETNLKSFVINYRGSNQNSKEKCLQKLILKLLNCGTTKFSFLLHIYNYSVSYSIPPHAVRRTCKFVLSISAKEERKKFYLLVLFHKRFRKSSLVSDTDSSRAMTKRGTAFSVLLVCLTR